MSDWDVTYGSKSMLKCLHCGQKLGFAEEGKQYRCERCGVVWMAWTECGWRNRNATVNE